MKACILIGVLISLSTVSGCATLQPWERGVLAKPEMGLDQHPLNGGLEDHTYFSKESSSGGRGFGGGGCGCN